MDRSLLKRVEKRVRKAFGSATVMGRLAQLEEKIDRLEHHSHGARATYVGNNRVLVKVVVARMTIAYFVEADDRLLSPWFIVAGGYETDLTNYYLRELRKDSHCIDVGSNFGYFTCLMSRFCPSGRVIGIEADRHVFEIARDNVAINNFVDRARVIHAAANADGAEAVLHRRDTRSGNTSIMACDTGFTDLLGEAPSVPFTVGGIRLDDLADELGGRVDFVKIDVEGAEPLVFEGARAIVEANPRLSIMMEWSPGQIQGAGFDISSFLTSLDAMGLRPFDLDGDRLAPLSFEELANLPYRAGVVLQR